MIKLDATTSTNDYAQALLTKGENIAEGTVVIADKQLMGRGQRGNSWVSEPGLNLTFSIILYPKFLRPSDQFELSKAISLGIVSYLRTALPVNLSLISVKWPNDIYVGDKKVCGILIENLVSGAKLTHSVVGIGLNVNQTQFSDSLPNPTSMHLVANSAFDLEQVRKELFGYLDARYLTLRNGAWHKMNKEYAASLYRFGEMREYQVKGVLMRAQICGIDDIGRLILESESGEKVHCDFKEVVFS
ncbi:MAG: biotin--[acetyl-CoA-carboxylase] ligase [Flavobacteriales bacterium]|nr:biotin--[acetyl-CoA-carboxylase] ligase [Flavobacteriales bacterium]